MPQSAAIKNALQLWHQRIRYTIFYCVTAANAICGGNAMHHSGWRRAGSAKSYGLSRFLLMLIALACLLGGTPAQARKIALVIGNSSYLNTSALTNPANDAQIVASAARSAGFDVIIASDLTMATFQRTLRDFRLAADGAEIAMIYYAGHGIEGQGKNWLIPVDSKLESQFDLPYEAINMDRLLESLGGAKVRIVVLDSCRNNPFGNAWKSGVRAVPMGLNGTEYEDVLVIYAAAPGQTATEGTGSNSPFAMSLAKRLPEPGLAIQMLGGAVRDDVLAATGGKQRPFVSASITGTPIFLVGVSRPAPVQVAAVPVSSPSASGSGGDRSMLDALMWQGAVSSNTLGGFQAYLREFPAGIFSNVAKENIAKLQPTVAPIARVATSAPVIASNAPPAPAVVPNNGAVAAPTVNNPMPQESGAGFVSSATLQNSTSIGNGIALPSLPLAPRFSNDGYPGCRENFQSIIGTVDKVDAINRCTIELDKYQKATLIAFREIMINHQKRISQIYTEQVGGQMKYPADIQAQFYKAMMKEHADSNPDGVHFNEYRAAEARYKEDRAYLQDRYCFNTGCAGYTAPEYVPSKVTKADEK
jgi:Caspase domain